MAKIAYVGLPAHGHTNPTLPIVQELVKRGHEVLYYNAESFRALVEPTGVGFRSFPNEHIPSSREISEALHEFINASLMFSQMSRPLARFMVAELQREQPDLVLYDSAAMWGYVAARVNHIPNACLITTFVLDGLMRYIGFKTMARFIWSALPHVPKLLRWRQSMVREFGKENSGGITEYADLNIIFTSQEFHPPNGFIDERFRFVGPSLNATTRPNVAFPFEQLQAGRKVYISLGTINHLDHDFYQAAFKAFGDYPAQFILAVGKNTNLTDLGEIPDNFIVRDYVPQLEILERVDAFITHGGMNSVHEGLFYGVPEIVVPHHFEQYINGKRLAETQAGVLLGGQHPYGRVTAVELRQALETILANDSYRQNAVQYGQSLKAAGGYQKAVAEIEAFLKLKAQAPQSKEIQYTESANLAG